MAQEVADEQAGIVRSRPRYWRAWLAENPCDQEIRDSGSGERGSGGEEIGISRSPDPASRAPTTETIVWKQETPARHPSQTGAVPSWPRSASPAILRVRAPRSCPQWSQADCNCATKGICALNQKKVFTSDCLACPEMATRELVIARYKENVAWLADVPPAVKVRLYTKTEASETAAGVEVIASPEATPREAGVYLRHIVERYDRLAALTFFAQAHPFDHAPDFLDRLRADYLVPTTLTCQYKEHWPPPATKDRDRIDQVGEFGVRYGDALANHLGSTRGSGRWFDRAAWHYLFDGPMPRPLWFGYGAMWAVPRPFIRSRPLRFWERLKEEVERAPAHRWSKWTDPPLNPWTMEALWLYVWSDPKVYKHHAGWC